MVMVCRVAKGKRVQFRPRHRIQLYANWKKTIEPAVCRKDQLISTVVCLESLEKDQFGSEESGVSGESGGFGLHADAHCSRMISAETARAIFCLSHASIHRSSSEGGVPGTGGDVSVADGTGFGCEPHPKKRTQTHRIKILSRPARHWLSMDERPS